MTQPRESPDLQQRLDQVVAQLQALQQSVTALHDLEQRLLHEVQAIKEAQSGQADKLEQVKRELYRGRWWRRLGLVFRLLVIGAIIAAVFYFLVDWQAFLQIFV